MWVLGTGVWGALYGGATHDQPWATPPEGFLGVTTLPGVLCRLPLA